MSDSKKSREQREEAEEAKKGKKISAPMSVGGSAAISKSSHSSSGHSEEEEGSSSSESKKRTHSRSSEEGSESAAEERSKLASPAAKKMNHGRKGAESQRITKKNDEAASLKQKGFASKWTDKDELKVLQSLVDMRDEIGADPSVTNPDWNVIYGYMMKISDWDFKFEKRQLCDKVRRFRIAFEKLGDAAPAFSNVHKKECYELSMKIWGKRDDDIVENIDGMREDISNVEDLKANFPLLAEEIGQVLNADVKDFSSETWFRFISLKEANRVEKEIRDFKLFVASKDLSLKRMAFSLVNGARTRARRASS